MMARRRGDPLDQNRRVRPFAQLERELGAIFCRGGCASSVDTRPEVLGRDQCRPRSLGKEDVFQMTHPQIGPGQLKLRRDLFDDSSRGPSGSAFRDEGSGIGQSRSALACSGSSPRGNGNGPALSCDNDPLLGPRERSIVRARIKFHRWL